MISRQFCVQESDASGRAPRQGNRPAKHKTPHIDPRATVSMPFRPFKKHKPETVMATRIAFVVIILIVLWVTGFGSLFRAFF